jgi:chain length determinant protein tyrosine kinase EpsG
MQPSSVTAVLRPESPADVPDSHEEIQDRSIGDLIREKNGLSPGQVESILKLQRERGIRFGEAAVALSMATPEDVLWALSRQFHYPYSVDANLRLSPELVVASEPFSERAEACRALRSQVIMRLVGLRSRPPAIAVVSNDRGDGRTYIAANLALSFAQLGARTLLIDGDMRFPRLHTMFNVGAGRNGLSSLLSGRERSSSYIVPVEGFANLSVLPVGVVPPNPLELVERPAFSMLLKELSTKFDHVIVDTPASDQALDGVVMASRCGAAIAVSRQDHTRSRSFGEMLSATRLGAAEILGVVLNAH